MSKNPKRGIKNVDLGWDELGVNLDDMFARSASPNGSLAGSPNNQGELPLDTIDHNPYQARQVFSPASLQELADSILEHGVIEPIIVRPVGERYEIVAGERRYRAALIAELSRIPARIMELDDTQAAIFTALENLQREDLDIEDEGRQFAYLQQLTGLSQRKLAQKLGVERQYISRRIRLLKRPDLLQEYRSGMKTLHQVLSLAGSDPDADPEGGPEDAEGPEESGSAGPTLGAETGSAGPTSVVSGVNGEDGSDTDIELVEREELSGYLVERRQAGGGTGAVGGAHGASRAGSQARGGTRFRWRPLQQFYTWVGRMKPEEVPVDERASVKAQVVEIKARLEQLERALEETEIASGS
jgi:ParB/RepB/Spo0J family partition protein